MSYALPHAWTPRPGGSRRAWVMGVLAGHLLALWALLQAGVWPDRARPMAERAAVMVRLWMPTATPAAAPPASPAPAERPRPPRSAAAGATRRSPLAPALAQPASAEPQAITAPAAAGAARVAEVAEAAASAASAPPPALNLALPRSASAPWRQRNPALDDPRFQGARKSLENLVAGAMGDGRWSEERLDNDRVRFRNGPQCVEMQRTRAGQLNLGGGVFRELWAAKPC